MFVNLIYLQICLHNGVTAVFFAYEKEIKKTIINILN